MNGQKQIARGKFFRSNSQFSLRRASKPQYGGSNVARRLEIGCCALSDVRVRVVEAIRHTPLGTSPSLAHVVRSVSLPSVSLARVAPGRGSDVAIAEPGAGTAVPAGRAALARPP